MTKNIDQKTEKIREFLRKQGFETGFSNDCLEIAIKNVCGFDFRTTQKWKDILTMNGKIKRISPVTWEWIYNDTQ